MAIGVEGFMWEPTVFGNSYVIALTASAKTAEKALS
jgi:hypothetical protein